MFNVAHVQHHQDTCVNATNATLKHENTKTWHLRDTPRRKNKRHWSKHTFRNNPKEQYAFNFLLVHWILQFTMLITLRCTLHRCSSRDIHHWKLCCSYHCKPSTKVANNKMVENYYQEMWQANFADRNQQSDLPPLAMHVDVWTSCTWPQRYVHKHDIGMCEWSFHRFIYGNLVTTSPSSKWWGSLDFERHVLQSWTNQSPNYSPNHSIGRSDGWCVQRAGT